MSSYIFPEALLTLYGLTPPVSFFGLPAVGVNNQTAGVRTGTSDYIWKIYQTFSDHALIRKEHDLLRWLDAQSLTFAVPAPVLTHTCDTLVATSEGYAALFPLLSGQQPDHSNLQQIEAVGAALGELHATLCRYPELFARLPQYSALDHTHPHIPEPASLTPQQLGLRSTEAEAELFAWWRAEAAQLDCFAVENYAALPHQVIHGDFAPSNTLYEAGQVTAMLDFEMASWDARAIDVAAGLKWSMRIWENADPWAMGTSFCRGYAQWIQLTDDEIRAIGWLMRLINAVSVIWWLGRDLAEKRTPSLQRIESARSFTTWLNNHEAQLKNISIQTAQSTERKIMPLVRISLMEGKGASFGKQVGQIVYEAMMATLNVPAKDHFQIIAEHNSDSLVYDPEYLDITRTDGIIMIQITLNEGRNVDMKKAFYRMVADRLHEELRVRKEDVLINLVEVTKENWSFGNGEAQYA